MELKFNPFIQLVLYKNMLELCSSHLKNHTKGQSVSKVRGEIIKIKSTTVTTVRTKEEKDILYKNIGMANIVPLC